MPLEPFEKDDKDSPRALFKSEVASLSKLGDAPVPPAEPSSSVPNGLKEPEGPGFLSRKATRDAYKEEKKKYDAAVAEYKRSGYQNAMKAYRESYQAYEQAYQKYAEQFETPLQKLFLVPKDRRPPVLDIDALSQNFMRVLSSNYFTNDYEKKVGDVSRKPMHPLPRLLVLYFQAAQGALRKMSEGETVGLDELWEIGSKVHEKNSVGLYIPDEKSAQGAILTMQVLNLLVFAHNSIPGIQPLLARKVTEILDLGIPSRIGLALMSVFVDIPPLSSSSLGQVFSFYGAKDKKGDDKKEMTKSMTWFASGLDNYFKEKYSEKNKDKYSENKSSSAAPPPSSESGAPSSEPSLNAPTLEDQLSSLNSRIQALEREQKEYTIITPLGKYVPPPVLSDYIVELQMERDFVEAQQKQQAEVKKNSALAGAVAGSRTLSPEPPNPSAPVAVAAEVSSPTLDESKGKDSGPAPASVAASVNTVTVTSAISLDAPSAAAAPARLLDVAKDPDSPKVHNDDRQAPPMLSPTPPIAPAMPERAVDSSPTSSTNLVQVRLVAERTAADMKRRAKRSAAPVRQGPPKSAEQSNSTESEEDKNARESIQSIQKNVNEIQLTLIKHQHYFDRGQITDFTECQRSLDKLSGRIAQNQQRLEAFVSFSGGVRVSDDLSKMSNQISSLKEAISPKVREEQKAKDAAEQAKAAAEQAKAAAEKARAVAEKARSDAKKKMDDAIAHAAKDAALKSLNQSIGNLGQSLDKAIQMQQSIIKELDEYLKSTTYSTSKKKIKLATDLKKDLEFAMGLGNVERLRFNQRALDDQLPKIESIEKVVKSISDAKAGFDSERLKNTGTLLAIIGRAATSMDAFKDMNTKVQNVNSQLNALSQPDQSPAPSVVGRPRR
jgi:hypothetical protein